MEFADKRRFSFYFFGRKGIECNFFKKNRSETLKLSIDDRKWIDFFLSVTIDLMNQVVGKVKYILARTDGIIGIVESRLNERIKNRETTSERDLVDDNQGKDGDGLETAVPSLFYASSKNCKDYKFGVFKEQTEWKGGAQGKLTVPQGVFTFSACRFDSVLSILTYLHSNHFSAEDKKEFQLNLPALSIMFQHWDAGNISFSEFRYLSHSMLLLETETDGEIDSHGPISSVYRRFKHLTGASIKDPSIMSLFATPYFEKHAACSPDRCDKVQRKMYKADGYRKDVWGVNMNEFNVWGSNRLNPIEMSFIHTPGYEQEYCNNCSGALTHQSFISDYQNFYSIFCRRAAITDMKSVAILDFDSMIYELVGIIYTNHNGNRGRPQDHFLSIVCKEHNGRKTYFLSDGPIADYRHPEELKNVNEFPLLYDNAYLPDLLIYQKVMINSTEPPQFSGAITIFNLGVSNNHGHSIRVELTEKVSDEYFPDTRELANCFVQNSNNLALVRGVAFSFHAPMPKTILSCIYGCMQVFFYNKVLAHKILTSERDSEQLQPIQKLLFLLRYSEVAEIPFQSYLSSWNSEDIFVQILRLVHGNSFITRLETRRCSGSRL